MPQILNIKYYILSVLVLTLICSTCAARESPLVCYHCSSDTVGAENFCGKTFDESNIPYDLMKEQNISVERVCNSTIDSEHERPVCRKTVEETLEGKLIVKRFCYYTNKSDPLNYCNSTHMDKNMRAIFCEDCQTDRCNSVAQLESSIISIISFLLYSFFS